MAKRTRKAAEKLPVESVSARRGEEIRGGGTKTKGKTTSRGNPGPYLTITMESAFVTNY